MLYNINTSSSGANVTALWLSPDEWLVYFKGEDKHLAAVLETKPEDDMNWMICNNCGFVHRSPVLEQHEYEKLYENYDMDIFEEVTPDEYFDNIISVSYTHLTLPTKA